MFECYCMIIWAQGRSPPLSWSSGGQKEMWISPQGTGILSICCLRAGSGRRRKLYPHNCLSPGVTYFHRTVFPLISKLQLHEPSVKFSWCFLCLTGNTEAKTSRKSMRHWHGPVLCCHVWLCEAVRCICIDRAM